MNVILYTFIRDLFFSGMLGWDVSTWTNTTMFLWVASITVAQCALNQFGIKLTTILTDFSGYLIFVITIILTILLFMHVPKWDFGQAFSFVNSKGFILRVVAGFDVNTNTATWLLQAIDPQTGAVLHDRSRGLLPPNTAAGLVLGLVSHTVASRD